MKINKLLTGLILLSAIGLTTISCLDDDGDNNKNYGLLPSTNLNINHDSIQPVGKPTNIKITYKLKGNCQSFIEFRKLPGSTTTITEIGAYGYQNNSISCSADEKFETKSIKITPITAGKNIVKVWAGVNSSGENIFVTDTINVPEK